MRPKIILKIEGGFITDIQSDTPVDIIIVDYDINVGDTSIAMPDGRMASPSMADVEVNDKITRNLFDMLKREIES